MRKTFKISHNIEITDETLHQVQYYWWCTGTSRPLKPSREGWRNANQSISESSEVRLIRMTQRPWPHHCCLFPDLNGAAECFHSTSAAQSSNGQFSNLQMYLRAANISDGMASFQASTSARQHCLSQYIYYKIQLSLPDPPQRFISSMRHRKKKKKLDESVSQKAPEFGIKWVLSDLLVCKANCITHAIRTYCYM